MADNANRTMKEQGQRRLETALGRGIAAYPTKTTQSAEACLNDLCPRLGRDLQCEEYGAGLRAGLELV